MVEEEVDEAEVELLKGNSLRESRLGNALLGK